MSDRRTEPPPGGDFASQARSQRTSVLGEYLAFLRHNRKWWLVPILAVLLIASALVVIGGTGAAPWLYTLF
jgi:hypothetical protein